MDTAGTRVQPLPAIFRDGLGTRHLRESAGGPLEVLTLHQHLTAVSTFEFLLRERVSRFAQFQQPCYAPVRDIEREAGGSRLALVSDHAPGVRLSRMLAIAEQNLLPLDVESALCLIRKLVSAVAVLHEGAPDASHGALAPERVVIAPDARLVIVEHVLGAALEQLHYSSDKYWEELRIPLSPADAEPRFTRRTDVVQVGMIALALLHGRPLAVEEYPSGVSELATGTFGLGGGFEPLPQWLKTWLSRMLWLDPQHAFASAVDARHAFDAGLAGSGYTARQTALESFLAQYHTSVEARAAAMPADEAAVAPNIFAAPPAPRPLPASEAAVPVKPAPVPVKAVPVPVKAAAAAPVPRPMPPRPVSPPVPQTAAPALKTVIPPALNIAFPPSHSRDEDVRDEEVDVPHTQMGNKASAGNSRRGRLIAAAVVVVALTSGGAMAARRYLATTPAAAPATGTLAIHTTPAGASVVIDGQDRGVTPLRVTLSVGPHTLDLSAGGAHREMALTVAANAEVSQFIDMPTAAPAVGQLQVRTDPSGAKVSVDGQLRGVSPLTVTGLAPGSHTVKLENEVGSVNDDVTIEAGSTASLVVPLRGPQGAPVSGWISIAAPAEVQVFENQRLLGSSRTDRIMVTAGRHDVEMVNESLGYRASQTIQVAPGQVAKVKPEWPQGTIAINAAPWANVWLDGQELGETPVGNTQVPIGTHEVIFRHPQLGEQRYTTTVTAATPARLSVDMRKK